MIFTGLKYPKKVFLNFANKNTGSPNQNDATNFPGLKTLHSGVFGLADTLVSSLRKRLIVSIKNDIFRIKVQMYFALLDFDKLEIRYISPFSGNDHWL